MVTRPHAPHVRYIGPDRHTPRRRQSDADRIRQHGPLVADTPASLVLGGLGLVLCAFLAAVLVAAVGG